MVLEIHIKVDKRANDTSQYMNDPPMFAEETGTAKPKKNEVKEGKKGKNHKAKNQETKTGKPKS